MSYILITDGGADLNAELAEKYDAISIPLLCSFKTGDVTINSKADLDAFYAKMKSGEVATTGCPLPERFTEFFEPLLKEGNDIIYVAISSALTATYQNAELAAAVLTKRYPQRKIFVVDSLCASLGQTLLIKLLSDMRKNGASVEEAYENAMRLRHDVCHEFTVETLTYLKRGGRVSAQTALIGNVLNIKPVMRMDEYGRLIAVGKRLGRKLSIKAIIDCYARKAENKSEQTVIVGHSASEAEAEKIKEKILAIGAKEVIVADIGCTIGAHSGPGTLAIFYLGKRME